MAPQDLRRLARSEKDTRVARRLLAIARALDGLSREAAVRLAGMDRQTAAGLGDPLQPGGPCCAVGPLEVWPSLPPDGGQQASPKAIVLAGGMLKDERYRSASIFGAVCPARDTGAAPIITHTSVAAMNLLLEEVAAQLPPGTHAVMLIDNAGWRTSAHTDVPPYSPELNAIARVWQCLRDRYLSGRLFTLDTRHEMPTLELNAAASVPGQWTVGKRHARPRAGLVSTSSK